MSASSRSASSSEMTLLLLLLLALSTCCGQAFAEHWAVIVAGSRGYDNYRHQADACHAYHIVRRHGIPAENVILMMYDDVATAKENPFPGKLFNKPTNNSAAAVDVYAGCNIDYRGDDVTPENFISVLLGDSQATKGKKVLGSGPSDRVFINFVDHGARSYVMFPHGQMLTGAQLTKTLSAMFMRKRFKELVFYVEACHAGSMFWSYQMSSINAYVTTAANGWEVSFGTYCPPMDYVDGKAMDTCLGDLYSVNWMEDSDRTDLSSETLEEQYTRVKRLTSRLSHVQQYGSSRIRKETVGEFQSNYDTEGHASAAVAVEASRSGHAVESAVESTDVALVLAFYRYLRAKPDAVDREELSMTLVTQIQERQEADRLFQRLEQISTSENGDAMIAKEREQISTTEDTVAVCEAAVLKKFATLSTRNHRVARQEPDLPIGFTSYSIKYSSLLTDLCASVGDIDVINRKMECAMDAACQSAKSLAEEG